MKRQTEYIERDDLTGATHLEISVNYRIGGMNYFSGKITPRGYYVSVSPVTKKNGMISCVMFSGCSQLIMTANRFSEKQLSIAIEKSKDLVPAMIEQVVEENKKAS
jgi:hypothetical protein